MVSTNIEKPGVTALRLTVKEGHSTGSKPDVGSCLLLVVLHHRHIRIVKKGILPPVFATAFRDFNTIKSLSLSCRLLFFLSILKTIRSERAESFSLHQGVQFIIGSLSPAEFQLPLQVSSNLSNSVVVP